MRIYFFFNFVTSQEATVDTYVTSFLQYTF